MESEERQNEFHRPQRKHAIVFLIAAVAISAIIVAWTFFLNKGTLAVSGKPPFTFSVRGETIACNQESCSVKLEKGSYQIIGEKEGYRDATADVTIERGKSAQLTLEFSFIPQVRVIGALVLPHARAPLHPSLLGKTKLENIPDDAEVVEISEGADRLLYVADGAYAIIHNGKKITSPISRALPAGLFAEGIAYLEKKGDGERLMFWNGAMKNEVVFFPRAFTQPTIKTTNTIIIITDTSDAGFVHYVADSKLKTRKRIPAAFQTSDFSLVGNLLVAEENGTVKSYDLATLQSVVLTGAISHHVAAIGDKKLLLFTDQKKEKSDDVLTISKALEDIETGVSDVLGNARKIYLAEMDLTTGETKTIAELPISSIEGISSDGKKVLVAGDGQAYEVAFGE